MRLQGLRGEWAETPALLLGGRADVAVDAGETMVLLVTPDAFDANDLRPPDNGHQALSLLSGRQTSDVRRQTLPGRPS